MYQNKKEDLIVNRSFTFALQIIDLYKNMQEQKEYVISKQILRSGTSIGANVEEASAAICRKEFAHKMSIASKEARETKYWLRLLQASQLVKTDYSDYLVEIAEIVCILTVIVRTAQRNVQGLH